MNKLAHLLDLIDETAGGFIRLAYLAAGITAVAVYFGAGHLPPVLENALNAALPWALAAAVETHTYITARRVRAAWQDRQASAPGSAESIRASGSLKVNLAILAGLLAFSCWNQLNYLATNWTPPVTALQLPGWTAYIIRALFVPAAFMAAAFLAPLAEPITAQIEAEARATLADVFKIARRQRRRMLQTAERTGRDMTGALVELVSDPETRRIISHAYAAISPAPVLESPTAAGPIIPTLLLERPESALVKLQEGSGSPDNDRPPTGPGPPGKAPQPGPGVRTPAEPIPLRRPQPEKQRKVAARQRTKQNAEARVRSAWHPGITISQLERAAHVSRSTAHKWNRVIVGEQSNQSSEVAQ